MRAAAATRREGEIDSTEMEIDPAGICNEARNVVGLMPHPERACESSVGSTDGRVVLESVITALADTGAVA